MVSINKQKKTYKVLISILSVIIILLFVGCSTTKNTTTIEDAQNASDLTQNKEQVIETYCSAYSTGDTNICNAINNSLLKLRCKNKVFTITAYKNKDASYCDKLDSSLEPIYEDRLSGLESASDIDVCKEIVRYISESKTDELCSLWSNQQSGELKDTHKSDLLLFCKGMYTFDMSSCEKISDDDLKKECMLLSVNC